MGKNKLARWKELGTFNNVIQPDEGIFKGNDHRIKGNWRKEIFKNENPVILELACGRGEYTTGLSQIFPEKNFIGVDIKGARMWRGAKTSNEGRSHNTAFLRTRIEFIDVFFEPDEVDEIWITFPDPHPGRINSNKRLTCPWFLNKYRTFLKNDGIIHLKTDNQELFKYTEKLIENNSLKILISTEDLYGSYLNNNTSIRNLYFPSDHTGLTGELTGRILSIRTHYEKKFLEEGLKINYLAFRLEKEKNISYGWEKK